MKNFSLTLFSFMVARKAEVVQFTVGYKSGGYQIPDTFQANRYSLIQMLPRDTILLRETVIYPWPTLEQFTIAGKNCHDANEWKYELP